eukprot:snap_masked-scaffold_32-processed-gene-3.5-mRNA-1 protein AED:1.00 eAED:1.00 QI:0/-1/0/0/-1/1/1/0/829
MNLEYVLGSNGYHILKSNKYPVVILGNNIRSKLITYSLSNSEISSLVVENPAVQASSPTEINSATPSEIEELINSGKCSIVIQTEENLDKAKETNKLCRNTGIKFVWVGSTFVFSDFGEEFLSYDTDDRVAVKLLVQNFEYFKEDESLTKLICSFEHPHKLIEGDKVSMKPIEGSFEVEIVTETSIGCIIPLPLSQAENTQIDNVISQVKPGKKLCFNSLEVCLSQLSTEDTNKLSRTVSSASQVSNKALSAVISGVASMEVLKGISQLFVPISSNNQFLFLDDKILPKQDAQQGIDEELKLQKLFLAGDSSSTEVNVLTNLLEETVQVTSSKEVPLDTTFLVGVNCSNEELGYLDGKAIDMQVPLFVASLNGVRASTKSIVPEVTNTYSSFMYTQENTLSNDATPKNFQICTVQNFPYFFEHALKFAIEEFETIFIKTVESVVLLQNVGMNAFMKKLDEHAATKDTVIEAVIDLLKTAKNTSAENCVKQGRLLFAKYLYNRISQLLYNFPPNQTTPDQVPFWTGSKRLPTPAVFSSKNMTHVLFVQEAAKLYAKVLSLDQGEAKKLDDTQFIVAEVAKVMVPDFEPASNLKIAANDAELEAMNQADSSANDFEKTIPEELLQAVKIGFSPCEKKDCVKFVHAFASVRAESFSVETKSIEYTSKAVLGLTPVLYPTALVVSGLVCGEIVTVLSGNKMVSSLANSSFNLASNEIKHEYPAEVQKFKFKSEEWSVWTKYEFSQPMTLKALIEEIEKKFEVSVEMVAKGNMIVWSEFMKPQTAKFRMKKEVKELIEEMQNAEITSDIKLEFMGTDPDTEEDVDLPVITYTVV